MPLYTVKNTRPRGSYTILRAAGPATLKAGEAREIEMTEAEARNAESPGIEIAGGGGAAPAPEPAAGWTPPADPAAAAGAVLALPEDTKWAAFRDAARAVLGPEAPLKKADLIAALQALAEE